MNHISRRLILIIGVELREFRAWIIQRPEVFHSFILVHETGIDRGIQEIATRQNIIPERTLKEYIQGKVHHCEKRKYEQVKETYIVYK